jgi:predicted anti-sigma-YlaC factor YlaD
VTTDPCRDWRGALGAAALGRIDPAEELALRAHLDGCAGCRDELRDLTAVARALDAVPVENVVSAPAEPPSALGGRVLARVAEERDARRTRRVRRYAAAATAFTAAAAAVIALVLVLGGGGSSPGTRVVLVSTLGATGSATLHSDSLGTEVEMQVAGLRPGHYYWAWITGDDGRRIPAGTFSGSRSSTKLHLMAAVPLNEASRIWVTDDQHRVVLDRHLPSN